MHRATGPLLTIDVGEREATTTDIDDELSRYLGGRAIATKLAHDRIPFDADPFGPENSVFFSTGPLQVSQMSFTGRMNVTGLSPLSDGLLSSNAGGFLSRNFADTGYSVVEVTGQSDELLAIRVTDTGVEFESVEQLSEAEVPAVSDHMEAEHDLDREHLVTVGPAGENGVRFASIMTYDSRAFGRGGLGAALGAKNVKTIAFSGDSRPAIDIPNDVASEIHRTAATSDDMMRRQGTNAGTIFKNDEFSLPTRYYQEMSFDGVEGISGEAVESKKYKKGSCSVCAFACKLPTRDEETGLETEGPEYETSFSFGSNMLVDDVVAVMKSNDLCDRFGMDTISCGNTIAAYLMAEDEFGNVELIHDLIEKIAHREGIGDTLAEGVGRIHGDLGVENWSVKGIEFAGHDGRVIWGSALSYAVSNRGADHMYSTTHRLAYNGEIEAESLDGAPAIVARRENKAVIRDSAILCAFGDKDEYVTREMLAELLDSDVETLDSIGANVIALERHFNNRRGMDRSDDDALPYDIPGLDRAIDEYYDHRGWNRDGTIPEEQVPA